MIAPDAAATKTAQSGTLPCDATTPPRITTVSPGKTKPTNADASSAGRAKTMARTTAAGSERRRSAILPMLISADPGIRLAFAELRAKLVRPRAARPVHPDGPGRVNLGPIFSHTPLVEDAVEDVGVDDIWPGD